MKTVHEKRRNELIERFISSGFEGMSREEALELLLCYSSPSVSMTETVNRLFERYPSFAAILNASPEELIREYGLDYASVALLHALPDIIRRYNVSDSAAPIESANAAIEYFRSVLRYETTEKLMACFLGSRLNIISCETISVGNVHRTASDPLDLIEAANRAGSKTVIIAHNHPSQTARASEADIASTRLIKRALRDVGIELLDHIIVSSDGTALSMKNEGFFPLLDN